jgi:hypothetical protein
MGGGRGGAIWGMVLQSALRIKEGKTRCSIGSISGDSTSYGSSYRRRKVLWLWRVRAGLPVGSDYYSGGKGSRGRNDLWRLRCMRRRVPDGIDHRCLKPACYPRSGFGNSLQTRSRRWVARRPTVFVWAGKRGQAPFAGTARRRAPTRSVGRRTKGACPLFPDLFRRNPARDGTMEIGNWKIHHG